MKKIVAIVMTLLLTLALFAGCSSSKSDYENLKKNGKMVVGITDFAPMDFKDENGDWTGFDAELARLVGKELGLEVKFMEIEWDNKILELNSGAIDCVWNGMTLNDEVKNSLSCTAPYVLNQQVVVVAEGVTVSSADDLSALSVAVEAGSAGAMAGADIGLTMTEVSSQASALMEVAAGTSDACIIDKTMANAMTGAGTSYDSLSIVLELTNEEYGIGFRKGSDLTQKVNDILQKFRDDGTLQALADKYGLSLA